ncbi:hypothetical protein Nans01_37220 [Nocardiopsis ansamitocini]|uniref:Uncharacterized protein n=1 Tax=Nocardiopsis ansamitocini TaxID=1670832 RepID=A0A9W6P9C1_9ACTN|nr:hypothetical protein Nans01_37220 [Nocardiopsis ansamitocini]
MEVIDPAARGRGVVTAAGSVGTQPGVAVDPGVGTGHVTVVIPDVETTARVVVSVGTIAQTVPVTTVMGRVVTSGPAVTAQAVRAVSDAKVTAEASEGGVATARSGRVTSSVPRSETATGGMAPVAVPTGVTIAVGIVAVPTGATSGRATATAEIIRVSVGRAAIVAVPTGATTGRAVTAEVSVATTGPGTAGVQVRGAVTSAAVAAIGRCVPATALTAPVASRATTVTARSLVTRATPRRNCPKTPCRTAWTPMSAVN